MPPRGRETAPAGKSAVICFVSLVRLLKLSRDKRPEGSLPAFAWNDVAAGLNSYPLHYRAAFAFSILLYPPSRWFTLRLPTREREDYGLTVFSLDDKMG